MAVVLGHDTPDAVPAESSILEQGLDSLTAIDLRNRLTTATGVTLSPAAVFDHPTPAALARLLAGELGEATPAAPVPATEPLTALFRQACAAGAH